MIEEGKMEGDRISLNIKYTKLMPWAAAVAPSADEVNSTKLMTSILDNNVLCLWPLYVLQSERQIARSGPNLQETIMKKNADGTKSFVTKVYSREERYLTF